mmetsp:Transcript_5290/g.18986  ORF Transcript_5290/g.18986 Transcript_5290/m.18986 type:complete len:286 (-) Transcript_5290:116-973(-)
MAGEGEYYEEEGAYGAGGGEEEEVIDSAYIEALAAESAARHEAEAAAGGGGGYAGHGRGHGGGYGGGGGGGEDDMEDGGGGGKEEEGVERPEFAPLTHAAASGGMVEYRKVRVPPHRMTPLRENWEEIAANVVEHLKLYIRMNVKSRCIELKTSEHTELPGAIQKAEDFCNAFVMGFDVADALALLRLDDIYVDQFEVTDVKPLKGDHLSRAIGRVAGQGGKTRHAIENATRTRIVVADKKVYMMGAYSNIQVARDTICSLILGTPPGKVYNQLRSVSARIHQRY